LAAAGLRTARTCNPLEDIEDIEEKTEQPSVSYLYALGVLCG
jgi:hypothetical protein